MKHLKAKGGEIYFTANYDLFNRHDIQRHIDNGNLKKIRISMRKHGFKKSCAISVYWKNGKLHLNNGHHRLYAAIQEGLAVFYVIEEEWTDDEVLTEGATGSRHKTMDHVTAHATRGNEHYKTILKYHHAIPGMLIPLRFVISMLHGEVGCSGNAAKKIELGTFEVKSTALIDRCVAFLEAVRSVSKETQSQRFIEAIARLMSLEEFDADRMKQKLRTNGSMLEPVSHRDQMLAQLEDIYNWRVSAANKVPLKFLAKKQAAESKLNFGKK